MKQKTFLAKTSVAFLVVGSMGLAGCMPDENDPNRRTKIGAAGGAVTGAVIGAMVDDKEGRGALIGAAAGALVGGGVGYYMDSQQQEFERELAREREAHELEIERLRDDSLKLTLDSEVSFDSSRANVNPAFGNTLDKIARVLNRNDQSIVHVIGHTDNVGDEYANQRLSLRRAESVSDYLISYGVPRHRLRTEGRGENEPQTSNATVSGRQANRRVEIFVKPIVQGRERRAYESPRDYSRSYSRDYY